MTGELSTETLVRYVLGEMTRSESEEAERAIADSRRLQARVAELRAMMDELARPPGWVAGTDLVGEVRARMARPPEAPARRRGWVVGGMAVAAAAVAILVVRGSGEPDGSGFRVKGSAAADPDRWVGIELSRGDAQPPIAPGQRLSAGELMVRYTNLGPAPFDYLMVFAVDAAGQVAWFYPAYERAGTDPAAIRIERGAARLPDLIEHRFAPGRLTVCGLFLRRPLTVGKVEAALAGRQPAPGERLPFSDAGQHCFDVEAP
ncbi:MAG TPA: hypothetical protein VKB80_09440 [Kofleriaceae bacterium]|nr:hypothetical protein [Kofleriaceae bacterium]